MTREQFFIKLERNLRVAEPKRREIIAELTTHLDEAGSIDPRIALGNPAALARKFDATHVGLWASGTWLYLTPIISIFLFLPSRYALMLAPSGLQDSSQFMGILYLFRFVPPIVGAILAGLSLARLQQPGRYVTLLIPLVFFTVNVVGLLGYTPDFIGTTTPDEMFVMNYGISIFETLILIGLAVIPYKMERSWWGPRARKLKK